MPGRLPLLVLLLLLVGSAAAALPTNVILMIADGMGPEHEQAARYYSGGSLAWDSAPNQALMTTDSLSGVTDSAASATAMATGNKVTNFAISVDGDGNPYPTSLEILSGQGLATGIVSTVYIEDASPAAFAAHNSSRLRVDQIATDYFTNSRPNVVMGGIFAGGFGVNPTNAAAAGYAVVENRAEMNALDITLPTHVSGQFGEDSNPFEWDQANGDTDFYDTHPYLSEMTAFALSFLEQDPDGFFLMVEQEHTDEAAHFENSDPNALIKNIFATLEFSDAVQVVLDWIALRADPTDTLLIVTADHETGNLALTADNGAGALPGHTWGPTDTIGHTGTPVNAYAWGQNGELVTGTIDNTDIFGLSTAVPEPGVGVLLVLGVAALSRRRRAD